MNTKKLIAGMLFVALCAVSQAQTSKSTSSDPDNLAKEYFSQIMGVASNAMANTKLYQFVYEWLGTNSRNQYANVKPIRKNDLQPGDLVFFKIRSRQITHVGIYLGDDKFAHAASSRGVMISNLNEAYWKRYYYNGGRPSEINETILADAGADDEENNLH